MIAGIESYFKDLANSLSAFLQGNEIFTCSFSAEQSDFVRFNHARIRQAGRVEQTYLTLRLIQGKRHASATLTLSGDLAADLTQCREAFGTLRAMLPDLPDDPMLRINTEPVSTHAARSAKLPATAEMVDVITEAGGGLDLVGFLASGPIQRGFANSLGQCNWHEVSSFNFEWSLYHQADKAVKSGYADFTWDSAALRDKMTRARTGLDVLRKPAKRLQPGNYRAFLAPAALSEIAYMMTWGGFSAKARQTHQAPLQKLVEGSASLSPMLTVTENTAGGLAPTFQSDGYARPDQVELIVAGRNANALISPRTAEEYGLTQNGADVDAETPQSMDIAAGALAQADVLRELGTGLYINNLWYLNFSDRMNCRLTGMTRFATFWVENGEIVAPVDVMRFDDSIYRILGSNLRGLTQERDFLPDSGTYSERLTASQRLPGALVDDFRLTL